jgi:hypothetical protein
MQGSGSIGLSSIYVDVLFHQIADGIHVVMLDRIGDLGACKTAS